MLFVNTEQLLANRKKEKKILFTFNYAINFGMPTIIDHLCSNSMFIQCCFSGSNKILLPDVKLKAQWDIGSQDCLPTLPLSSSSLSQPKMFDAKCFLRNKSDIINLLIFIFSIFCVTYKSWSNNGCCDSKVWSDDLSNSLNNRHRYWNNCNPPLLVIIIRRMFEDVAAESRGVGR